MLQVGHDVFLLLFCWWMWWVMFLCLSRPNLGQRGTILNQKKTQKKKIKRRRKIPYVTYMKQHFHQHKNIMDCIPGHTSPETVIFWVIYHLIVVTWHISLNNCVEYTAKNLFKLFGQAEWQRKWLLLIVSCFLSLV